MTASKKDRPSTPPEQIVYANLLLIGAWFGLFLLIVTYGLYLSGLLPAHVPISKVPDAWGLGVDQYLHETDSPNGWGWISLLYKGDFLNYVGFAFLGLTSIICYLVLMGSYVRSKDWLFLAICILEIVVLAIAASNVLPSGGH